MADVGTDQLTDHDRGTLDGERPWWKYAGAKAAEIGARFEETATRYYQRLNALLDRPEPWPTTRRKRARDASSALLAITEPAHCAACWHERGPPRADRSSARPTLTAADEGF